MRTVSGAPASLAGAVLLVARSCGSMRYAGVTKVTTALAAPPAQFDSRIWTTGSDCEIPPLTHIEREARHEFPVLRNPTDAQRCSCEAPPEEAVPQHRGSADTHRQGEQGYF